MPWMKKATCPGCSRTFRYLDTARGRNRVYYRLQGHLYHFHWQAHIERAEGRQRAMKGLID
jgi:hypothetical protein